MLCVPVDEEIPEVSDSVVKAITGEFHWDIFAEDQGTKSVNYLSFRVPVKCSD